MVKKYLCLLLEMAQKIKETPTSAEQAKQKRKNVKRAKKNDGKEEG